MTSVWPVALAVLVLAAAVLVLAGRISTLNGQVRQLERACIPVDTGGGVTQCLQPNVAQTARRPKRGAS